MSMIHQAISQMCADLGKDPLLVQGAGGNVSWKEGDTLWIKGSGTWLANALLGNIFVPVQLQPLQAALAVGNTDIAPKTVGEQSLRPSIETVLHALMPHPIVVHLHAIHALSHLVIKNCQVSVSDICRLAEINAVFVEYHKPGPQLAKAILEALQQNPTAKAVFLKNHGIVVGGSTIEEVQKRIEVIHNAFQPAQTPTKGVSKTTIATSVSPSPIAGYTALQDNEVQALGWTNGLSIT
jgi:rhamnose utilization protein RhaD (predicted bifunctional aldolase and dehydrogenase)